MADRFLPTPRLATPRLADWRPRLVAYLAGVAHTPFVMGSHDCALFVAGAVQAMTAVDPAAGYRGRYSTAKAGLKAVLKQGFTSHEAVFAGLFAAIPPAMAAVGDIAVIDKPGDIAILGLFEGERIAVAGDDGLAFVPRALATSAYRVA